MRPAGGRGVEPRMGLGRALRSEALRLRRSPLVALHAACGLAGGVVCGAYFSVSAWDPALGADAYVQLLGAMMPLMAGISCGLAVDEERRAGRMANLTGAPARGSAILAKWAALVAMGAAALALAVGTFAALLALAGRLTLGAGPLALSWALCVLASAPLYALLLALALRLGRNAAIGVGAVGPLCAFFSVGGLAHGLMTGELTGAAPGGVFALVPFAWPARLASLGVEAAIAAPRPGLAAQVANATLVTGTASALLCAAGACALALWFRGFEEGKADA